MAGGQGDGPGDVSVNDGRVLCLNGTLGFFRSDNLRSHDVCMSAVCSMLLAAFSSMLSVCMNVCHVCVQLEICNLNRYKVVVVAAVLTFTSSACLCVCVSR